MFIVVEVCAWPNRLDTVFRSCLLAISSVAEVCRRPWKGISGSCLSRALPLLYRRIISYIAWYGVE